MKIKYNIVQKKYKKVQEKLPATTCYRLLPAATFGRGFELVAEIVKILGVWGEL